MSPGWTLKDAARRLKKACVWAGCGYCAQDIPQCRNCGKRRPCAGATFACQQANIHHRCGCTWHAPSKAWVPYKLPPEVVEAQRRLDWWERTKGYFK